MDLFDGMTHPDPAGRFSIADVKESKWYRGKILKQEKYWEIMTDCAEIRNEIGIDE